MGTSIAKVWFDDRDIWIATSENEVLHLPLEVFPALFEADSRQRSEFYLWDDARSIRWPELDEDIHISHFYEKEMVDYDNPVYHLLEKCPYLDMKALAEYIGMHWTLLARLKYGVVKVSDNQLAAIRNGILQIAHELQAAV